MKSSYSQKSNPPSVLDPKTLKPLHLLHLPPYIPQEKVFQTDVKNSPKTLQSQLTGGHVVIQYLKPNAFGGSFLSAQRDSPLICWHFPIKKIERGSGEGRWRQVFYMLLLCLIYTNKPAGTTNQLTKLGCSSRNEEAVLLVQRIWNCLEVTWKWQQHSFDGCEASHISTKETFSIRMQQPNIFQASEPYSKFKNKQKQSVPPEQQA